MTHFETLLVTSMRDLAKEVHETNALCERLDERSASTERRLITLESAIEAATAAAPVPRSRARKRLSGAKDIGISAAAVVALATSLLQMLSPTPAPAAPRAPTSATGAQ